MFTFIHIQGFRTLRDLKLDGLGRINLLMGKNGTGKTTLLEALFLLLGAHNPEISVRLNVFRGIQPFTSAADETWGWLFHGKDTSASAVIEAQQDDGTASKLTLSLQTGAAVLRPADETPDAAARRAPGSYTTAMPRNELVFEVSRDGQRIRTSAVHKGDGLEVRGEPNSVFPTSTLLSTHARYPEQDAQRFARLEEDSRDQGVIEVLRALEPDLKRLSVYIAGDRPALRADVGLGRLIPVAFLGEGFVRTVTMVLAVLSTPPGGGVLVDEVDTGLHYSAFRRVWAGLGDAARAADIQLFATSHSRECVSAAHTAAKERLEYDLSAYRLERTARGIEAVRYSRESLETALDLDWEVR